MKVKFNFFTLLSILVSMVPFGMYYCFYSQMPEHIPMHYDASGQVDRLVNKSSPEVLVVCALGIYGLCFMKVLEIMFVRASQRDHEENKQTTKKIMSISTFFIALLFSGISAYYLFIATKSIPFDMKEIFRLGFLIIGIVLAIIGNFLPKLRQNKLSGFRTRLTLKDDFFWFQAQRFASKTWVFGGVLLMLTTFIPGKVFIFINIVIFFTIMIVPLIYVRIKSSTFNNVN